MKKIISALFCAVLMITLAFASFAAVPSADLRAQADSLDLGNNMQGLTGEVAGLHGQGVRLFDTAGLLSSDSADKVEERLAEAAANTGVDAIAVTTNSFGDAADSEKYSDLLYQGAGFGTGSDKSGAMLVINMNDGAVYVYTYGQAVNYITDSELDYIYDELDGGLISKLKNADIEGACKVFAAGLEDGYAYVQENGQTKKGGFSFFKLLISALVAAVAGFLPVSGVKRKYAMKSEKRMAEGFNLAYRANSTMALAAAPAAAKLISRNVSRMPIPAPSSDNRAGGHSSGHGGGPSTMHTSVGGGMHGGGGRKF